MPAITMTSGRTGHWTKMHRSLVKFSESEASNHAPSLADFTTTTPELKFSVHTGIGFPPLSARWRLQKAHRNWRRYHFPTRPDSSYRGLDRYLWRQRSKGRVW